MLAHFRVCWRPGGVAYVSTPNLLTLAPAGAAKSDNPWHIKEYRAEEFRELCRAVFAEVRAAGPVSCPQAAAARAGAAGGWDAVHRRLGITKLFYDRFTPAISAQDFALRSERLDEALDFLAICRT